MNSLFKEKKKNEAESYEQLKRAQPQWKFLRIENLLGRGTPDLLISLSSDTAIWAETKALPESNVQLRGDQYVFLLEYGETGIPCWVFNWDQKKELFSAWLWPFSVEPGKKGHVRITSDPRICIPIKEMHNLTEEQFKR